MMLMMKGNCSVGLRITVRVLNSYDGSGTGTQGKMGGRKLPSLEKK